jgi:hypothetical protein
MTALIHRIPLGRPRIATPLIEEARERQRRRRRWVAVLMIVAVGAGAIGYGISRGASGGRSSGSCAASPCASSRLPPPTIPKPCTLLTNAEAAKAVGSAIQDRSAQAPVGMVSNSRFQMCTWTGAPLSSFRSQGNELVIMVSRSTKPQFEQAARTTRSAVAVRGLGQPAFAIDGPAHFLNVFHGGYTFTFQIGAVNPIASEKQIARLVLARVR